MKNFYISKSRRVRSTPFTKKIEEQGVKSYTVYNHMLLPTTFSNIDEEYLHRGRGAGTQNPGLDPGTLPESENAVLKYECLGK